MLKLGGYINILIAIGHIVGLIWAYEMFEVTGIGKEMTELAQTHIFSMNIGFTMNLNLLKEKSKEQHPKNDSSTKQDMLDW